jgi:hypothetical protein
MKNNKFGGIYLFSFDISAYAMMALPSSKNLTRK